MNIRDYEYAVAVADHGHFGRAAEACHVSQPALSGQIRKLEARLGVDLFERTKRSVKITPAGEAVVERARELLRLAAGIEDAARALADPLAGSLRLGAIPTIAPYLAPLLVPPLLRALPNAELKLAERFTRDLEQAVASGDLDAAITATPPALPQLAEISLYEEPFWIALPSDHPLGREDDVDVRDLLTEPLLLLADGHCLRDQVLSFYARGFKGARGAPRTSTEETSLTTILALVGGGLGVTLVPAMSVSGSWVTDSGIALRKERSGAARRRVRLIHRASFPRMALLDKLADVIGAIVPDTVAPARR